MVETYRDAMRTLGLRNPKLSARKLLQIVSTDEEYDQGRVVKAAESADKPKVASTVIKKPAQPEMPRERNGRVSITKALDLLMARKR